MTATRARPRIEGPLKLTGAARYAADHRPDGVLHAVLVGAPVAAGRLRGVDAAAALVLPGVTAVLTAADLPAFPELPPPSAVRVMPFSDDRIRYEGQPVAIVLAESIEAAEAGRAAVIVDCEPGTPVLIGHGQREPVLAEDRGDLDAALARAVSDGGIRIEQTYLQAPRHHHTMETSGTVAEWDGGRLILRDAVQASSTVIPVVSTALGIDAADEVVGSSSPTGVANPAHADPNRLAGVRIEANVDQRVVSAFLRLPYGDFEAPMMLVAAVELLDEVEPFAFTTRDLIEILFHLGGEFDVNQVTEVLAQQPRHGECREARHERFVLPEHVAAPLDGANRRGIGRRPADAEPLELFDEGGLAKARRRRGFVALRLERHGEETCVLIALDPLADVQFGQQ